MIRKGYNNDLFFCSWILNKVAYETNNHLVDVINGLKPGYLKNLYKYADVFHCENPDKMSDEIIEMSGVTNGKFIRKDSLVGQKFVTCSIT